MRKFFGLMSKILTIFVTLLMVSSCATSDNSAETFSSVDIMFAEMMIPHHQQAIEMSDLALAKTSNEDVRALAMKIRSAQAPEIDEMKSWPGVQSDSHMGHTMMGMLNEDEMASLENSTGADFDRLFLEGMIKHHEGALDMAEMIQDSKNPTVLALGRSITETQKAEIEYMKELLKK